jgi:hypothetical protein
MGQRHKHADVIIAWAEGKDVQVRDEGTKRWFDVMPGNPIFSKDREYRIKPPSKKYRVALLKDDSESYALAANSQAYADIVEFRKDFVRWLTDWVDYEEKCGG